MTFGAVLMRIVNRRRRLPAGCLALALAIWLSLSLSAATASIIPPHPVALEPVAAGFSTSTAIAGLTNPTAVAFSVDGRVFVAEKSGLVLEYAGLDDPVPTIFADLRPEVDDFWDRGLLGFALDPQFTTGRPFAYALYDYDAAIGGTAPTWNDDCPTPPGATTDGCVISGHLAKLTAHPGGTATEQVLIEDWCQQFPSHSIGTVLFGRDGYLYAGAGEGANINNVDYGQFGGRYAGDRRNPCGDPPGGVGGTMTPPTAEGGALRSQSVRRTDGPTTLDGTIIRVDPDTGAAAPTNPFADSQDANKRRVIAYGLRNPFRFTTRPSSDQLWIGDVGFHVWEEIDTVADTTDRVAENFGWPCYEGAGVQSAYQAVGLNLCSTLPGGAVTPPTSGYRHVDQVVPGETCSTGSSAISGIAFYGGGSYPGEYDGAMFFADHSRNCIWAEHLGADGNPNPASIHTLIAGALNPVGLTVGPGGDLFYVNLEGGTIERVSYVGANVPPTARISAMPSSGDAPLTVAFDGRGSTDPEGGALTYDWDLDGDGSYGDSTATQPSFVYRTPGSYTVGLRVSDPRGATDMATTVISAGVPVNSAPTAVIDPSAPLRWRVGQVISFSGHATDEQDGALPPAGLTWTLVMHHCPSNCHTHTVQTFSGVAAGSFTAPDHEYPSYLELRLTATDSGGATGDAATRLNPYHRPVTLDSAPSGLLLSIDGVTKRTSYQTIVVQGHTATVTAAAHRWLGGSRYTFVSWSDGGPASHEILGSSARTLTATYRQGS